MIAIAPTATIALLPDAMSVQNHKYPISLSVKTSLRLFANQQVLGTRFKRIESLDR